MYAIFERRDRPFLHSAKERTTYTWAIDLRNQPLRTLLVAYREGRQNPLCLFNFILVYQRFDLQGDGLFVWLIEDIVHFGNFHQGITTSVVVAIRSEDVHVGAERILGRDNSTLFQLFPCHMDGSCYLSFRTIITEVHKDSHNKLKLIFCQVVMFFVGFCLILPIIPGCCGRQLWYCVVQRKQISW